MDNRTKLQPRVGRSIGAGIALAAAARSDGACLVRDDKKKDDTPIRRGEALGTTSLLHHQGASHTRPEAPRGLVMDATKPDHLVAIRHLGVMYMAVFQDATYTRIVSLWERDRKMKWKVIWSFLRKTTLTQKLKNISAKCLIEGQKLAAPTGTE